MDKVYYAPIKSVWTIKWDGEVLVSPSAHDALQSLGERSYVLSDHKYPKRGIAYRAFVQYRIVLDDEASDEDFLRQMAEFGIIELTVTGERPADYLSEAVEFSMAWHGGK